MGIERAWLRPQPQPQPGATAAPQERVMAAAVPLNRSNTFDLIAADMAAEAAAPENRPQACSSAAYPGDFAGSPGSQPAKAAVGGYAAGLDVLPVRQEGPIQGARSRLGA